MVRRRLNWSLGSFFWVFFLPEDGSMTSSIIRIALGKPFYLHLHALMNCSTRRRFCSLLCASVNALQKTALVSLDYNLTISNADWETWMLGLIRARSQRKFPRQGMATLVAALCEVLSVTRSNYGGETFTSKTPASPDRLDDLHTQILAGLIDSEKGPSRLAANPSEIVCTTSRLA